jgi:hypothetical protein
MQNGVLCRVTELSADTRHAMESILGRPLQEDEAVSVNTYKPVPTGKAREEASRRLLERVEKTSQKAAGIPDEQIDAAIDEAADYVRHH